MAKPLVEKKKYDYGNPYMTKDMAHIVLKLVLLRRIQKKDVYSYALIKEMGTTGHMSKFIRNTGAV